MKNKRNSKLKDYTEIVLVLDESGSMGHLRGDTIGSYNAFLAEQQALPDEARYSLVVFNTQHRYQVDGLPIRQVPQLTAETYRPSGGTALLDATGIAIDTLGRRLASLPEKERPARVVVAIFTDGEENSSHIYNQPGRIKQMIEHQQSVYGWQFVYLGANQDSFKVAESYGVSYRNIANTHASAAGASVAYSAFGATLRSYRADSAQDMAIATDEQGFIANPNLTSMSAAKPYPKPKAKPKKK